MPLPISVASGDSQLVSEPSILRIFCSVLCLPIGQKLLRHSTWEAMVAPSPQHLLVPPSPIGSPFKATYHTSHRPRATSLSSPVSPHFKISCCLLPSTPLAPSLNCPCLGGNGSNAATSRKPFPTVLAGALSLIEITLHCHLPYCAALCPLVSWCSCLPFPCFLPE